MGDDFLYKYRSLVGKARLHAERLLVHSEAYFASPATFNDPFDCRVRFSMVVTDEEYQNYFLLLFRKFHPDWTEEARRKEVDQIIVSGRHRDPQFVEHMTERFQAEVNTLGVLCLAKKPDHILMWSHYCNGHMGFCVQFLHENEPFFGRAQQVKYSYTYPQGISLPEREKWADPIVLTKAKFWAYEEEWRVFELNHGPGVYRFPPELLTGVILGCCMPDDDRQQVRKWALQRRPQPQLYAAWPKANEFGLEVMPID